MARMSDENTPDLLQLTEHCGCGAKLAATDLRDILAGVVQPSDPALLIGSDTFDDAAIYRVRDDCLLVQSADFFPPVASDPHAFGQIAACNALSDIYAMGGRPITALALLCFPAKRLPLKAATDIIAGAARKLAECGASLVGGHTLDDPQLKFGLSVTGLVEPEQMLSNAGAQPGDVLLLTKPLGTGLTITAAKAGLATKDRVEEANDLMATLNRDGALAACRARAHAATDITGFGLLGHAWQLAEASRVQVRLYAEGIPLLAGALEFASMGLVPAGAYANRRYLDGKVSFSAELSLAQQDVLFDPQTSGGLLVSLPAAVESEFHEAMKERKASECAVIGRIDSGDKEPRILVER